MKQIAEELKYNLVFWSAVDGLVDTSKGTTLKLGGICRCRSARSRCLAIMNRTQVLVALFREREPQNLLALFYHPVRDRGDVLL